MWCLESVDRLNIACTILLISMSWISYDVVVLLKYIPEFSVVMIT